MIFCLPLEIFITTIGRASEDTLNGGLRTSNSGLWTANGTAICNAYLSQSSPQIVSDGAGGAIIAWIDNRNSGTTGGDIYAQKINSAGTVQWTTNGVVICNANYDQIRVNIIGDGAGGAIITWCNYTMSTGDIYAQKVDSVGITKWTTNGVVICNATDVQDYPQIISDGAGGAIITWHDERSGNKDIYAQQINSAGVIQWTTNGKVICNATNDQWKPQLVSDGSRGAIVTWLDERYVSTTGYDIYAQKIDSAGAVLWDDNGTVICNATGHQASTSLPPQLASDGAGGAILVWSDNRPSTTGSDIYAQKIDSTGAVQWDANGTLICNATDSQSSPQIISNGAGGGIISWTDQRYSSTTDKDIYSQKINSVGKIQWEANGTIICNAPSYQVSSKLVSDGAGGAIVGWEDEYNIKAHKINSAGVLQWDGNGTIICNADSSQYGLEMVSDGAGGAILTWQDGRNLTTSDDIYAQKIGISLSGGGGPIPGFDLVLIGVISAISVLFVAKMHNNKKKLMFN